MPRHTLVARSVRAFLFLVSLAIAANSPTALAAQSVKAYVANYGANTVSVINTTTNAVAAVVTVGNNPRGVAIKPDGSAVYVTNFTSNTISVIAPTSNTVVATIAGLVGPFGITFNSNGTRAYVTNLNNNSVTVIDTTANVVLAQIVVGAAPTGISFRPAAGALPDRVYVANRDGSNGGGNPLGTVSIIDPTTNAVVATVGNIAVAPIGIVAAPSGDVVATTRDNTGNIYQINGATNAITTSLSAGANTEPHGVAIRPDGARLYVATVGSGAVPRTGATKVYDGAGALVTNIVGTAPVDLAVNPSGSRLYVANYDSASVQVVDTTTNAVLSTVAVGSNPWGIAVAATNDPDTVPTLSEWALILFGSLMAGTMVWYQRRRV